MKKLLLILLAVSFAALSAAGCAGSGVTPEAGAAYEPDINDNDDLILEDDEMNFDDGSDIIFDDKNIVLPGEGDDYNVDTTVPDYFSVTGDVKSIEDIEGVLYVTIEDPDGNPAVFVIGENTVFPFSDEINIGDTITGWYRTDMPMMMIWPSQYNIAVLAAGVPDDVLIKVDRFHIWHENMEGYLLSQDSTFAFITDENTEIILADGLDFSEGQIEGRRIVVIYDISTRSLPEMTTANKLIVLFEDIMPIG